MWNCSYIVFVSDAPIFDQAGDVNLDMEAGRDNLLITQQLL